MFVQVVEGQVAERERVRATLDRWVEEVSEGAEGWLGTTAGVTEDGQFVALARFDSEDNARRNSDRPEQDAWWTEMSELFVGQVMFSNSLDVLVDVISDPAGAGFVQVMRGRGSNRERARELLTRDEAERAAFRPDIIASVAVEHESGAFTMAMYFTSEAEARAGESKEPPPELRARMEQLESLMIEPPRFLDLRAPWFYEPR